MNVPHPSEFLLEELEARGWSLDRLAIEMGGDAPLNRLALDFWLAVQEPNCRLGEMSDQFAKAFGVSSDLFRNLEAAWLASLPQAVAEADASPKEPSEPTPAEGDV